MEKREMIIELIAQTLAPRLYQWHGKLPQDEGFPICDTEEEFEAHMERMSDPIGYWTEKGRTLAVSVINILDAGGVPVESADFDAMCKAAVKERPDIDGA